MCCLLPVLAMCGDVRSVLLVVCRVVRVVRRVACRLSCVVRSWVMSVVAFCLMLFVVLIIGCCWLVAA